MLITRRGSGVSSRIHVAHNGDCPRQKPHDVAFSRIGPGARWLDAMLDSLDRIRLSAYRLQVYMLHAHEQGVAALRTKCRAEHRRNAPTPRRYSL